MKFLSRILLVLGLVGTLFGVTPKAYAMEINDYIGVSPNPPGYNETFIPMGTEKPSDVWSWSSGNYVMSGSTSNTNLYTNYLFTGVSTLNVTFTKADEAITIEVWKRNTGLFQSDKKISTKTVSRLTADDLNAGNTRNAKFTGLSSSGKYYIKVLAPAHFKATIGY